jgi:hypothetical protein
MWRSHHSCPLTETVIDETTVEWMVCILMNGGIGRALTSIQLAALMIELSYAAKVPVVFCRAAQTLRVRQ